MAKKTEKNERSRFGKVCSILTDILVFPVIIIAFACAIFMSSAKANNKVPSIFGNSIVEVLTNSMDLGTEQSYKPGDVLIINQNINIDQIEVGDCIAFYAPKQSGYVDDQGNSLIIFHRVVRIVFVKDNDVNKRYFVCHGDNAGPLTYVQAENIEESTHNAEGNVEPGGGYVVKLVDDTNPAINQDHTLPNSQSQLQYVADEFVVGELKSRAGGLITGLVKFCTSPIGITAMVIIPSAIMIGLVVVNMIRETKAAKKEKDDDSLVFAQSMAGADGSNTNLENATTIANKEEKLTGTYNKENIEDTKTPEAKPANKDETPKSPSKPEKAAPAKEPMKDAPKVKPVKEEKQAKAESKPAPAKPVAESKVAPEKAPAKPKAEPVKATQAKIEPKSAPVKPVAETKVAPAPKATPVKAPVTPKAAPSKPAVEGKAAPAKTPVAPKSAPAKTPAAPKAAPPKKG